MNTKILILLIALTCLLNNCSKTLEEKSVPMESTLELPDMTDEELKAAGYEIFEAPLVSNPKSFFLPKTKEVYYAQIEKLLKEEDETKLDGIERFLANIYQEAGQENLLYHPQFSVELDKNKPHNTYPILEIPEEEVKLVKYTSQYISELERKNTKVYVRLLARPLNDFVWSCRKILSVREGVR